VGHQDRERGHMPPTSSQTRLAATVTAVGLAVMLPITAVSASADPVGLGYSPANRVLTIPLIALVVWMFGETHTAKAAGAVRSGRALLIGSAMMLLGNVIEFWVGLAQSRPVEAIASPRHEAHWVGSNIGYPIFFLGSIVLLVALALEARALRRNGSIRLTSALARPAFPIALTAAMILWSSSVAATLVAGVVCALLVVTAATDGANARTVQTSP
jgi:hypothetical protein